MDKLAAGTSYFSQPGVVRAKAWIFLFLIRNERCDEWLENAEAVIYTVNDPEEKRYLRGQIAAIRSTVAIGRSEHEQALVFAHEAQEHLPAKVALLRALIYLNIGDAYMHIDFEVSAEALREAIRLSRELVNPGFTMICAGSLVNLFLFFGRLKEASSGLPFSA